MAEGRAPSGYLTGLHARWLAERPDRRHQEIEGTLLFADVSGFTVLGERLAKQGRIGAEILSDTVNTVFAGMLDVVSFAGGEILKFGGDAILALFTGPEHEARGCSAGAGMQSMLRALRRERAVNLRLSVGVASGRVNLFLAGTAPCELIVAGPLATEVLILETAAEAGQVLVSSATAARVPTSCLGSAAGPGVLLRGAPRVAPLAPPAAPQDFDPTPWLPPHLHGHVPGNAEHRAATVGFVQFRGTDALLADAGPEALAQTLDDVVGTAAETARTFGVTFVGTDVDKDAGKVILTAGAPTASPNDDDRMLHAVRSILDGDHRLTVRAGVNRGRVFTVDIGTEQRRTWTVMGDAVNLAARVMGRSEPRTVLATQTVLSRLHDDFERDPIPPFTVKGKTAPVFAEQVGAARGASISLRSNDAPLVGREDELATICDALAAARDGRTAAVEIVAEPGMGKSRLVEAALADSHGLTFVGISGGPYAAHSPYRALRSSLRELLGARDHEDDAKVESLLRGCVKAAAPDLLPWLPLIGIAFGLRLPPTPEVAALSPEFARARLNAETSRLIGTLLPPSGTLLVVEDAHWVDDASGDLVRHLVGHLRGRGTCVLITRRDVPDGLSMRDEEGTVVLHLAPLNADAAFELLTADDEAMLPPDARATLVDRAGGNPLLLQELIAAARAGQPLDALPDSVEALVTARIDTLPRGDRSLLRRMAVLGVRVPTSLLEELLATDRSALRAALDRLEGFIIEDGPGIVRFRHGLLRDAAYETLPFRHRRALHAQAGDVLLARASEDAESQAELLSLHFHAAARWPESWRFSRAAAGNALRQAAPVEAAAFLERALEAGRQLETVAPAELAAVAEELGDVAKLAARYDRAAEAYATARRHAAGDPLAHCELYRKEGLLREVSEHYSQALRWYTRALKLIAQTSGDSADAVRGRLTLAQGAARIRQGRYRTCIPLLDRAAEVARRTNDLPTLAHAYYLLDWAHTELGTGDKRYRELPLPIYEELGDNAGQAKVLNNLGTHAYYEGRWDEALGFYERSRAANERVGDVVQTGIALNNIAEIRSDQGHLDEAERLLREALAIWRPAGFKVGVGLALSNLGRVSSRQGELDCAARLLAEARAELDSIGAEALVLEVDAREAERLLFAGRHAEVLTRTGAIRAAAERRGAAPVLLAMLQRLAGYAKLQAGYFSAARERFAESAEFARSVGAAFEEALALDGLASTGGPEAETQRAESRAILERLGVVDVAAVPLSSV